MALSGALGRQLPKKQIAGRSQLPRVSADVPRRYYITRTPGSVHREAVALAEARTTPRVSAAGPPKAKVLQTHTNNMPEGGEKAR